jgi:thiol-disulfide isomerase/thioredoxin
MNARQRPTALGQLAVAMLVLLIVGLVLYTVSALRAAGGLPVPPVTVPPEPTGLRMDYAWSVIDPAGATVALDTMRGKVLFLNIWSTTCPPCVYEMPAIDSLHGQMAGEGVVFLLVAPEGQKEVREFADAHGLAVPLCTTADPIPWALHGGAVPTTHIVSRAGDVVFTHVGWGKWDDPKVLELLRYLLAEPAPAPVQVAQNT